MKISIELLKRILNDAINYATYEGGTDEINITVETPGFFIATQENNCDSADPVVRKYSKGDPNENN